MSQPLNCELLSVVKGTFTPTPLPRASCLYLWSDHLRAHNGEARPSWPQLVAQGRCKPLQQACELRKHFSSAQPWLPDRGHSTSIWPWASMALASKGTKAACVVNQEVTECWLGRTDQASRVGGCLVFQMWCSLEKKLAIWWIMCGWEI